MLWILWYTKLQESCLICFLLARKHNLYRISSNINSISFFMHRFFNQLLHFLDYTFSAKLFCWSKENSCCSELRRREKICTESQEERTLCCRSSSLDSASVCSLLVTHSYSQHHTTVSKYQVHCTPGGRIFLERELTIKKMLILHMDLAEWFVHWAPELLSRVQYSTRSPPWCMYASNIKNWAAHMWVEKRKNAYFAIFVCLKVYIKAPMR